MNKIVGKTFSIREQILFAKRLSFLIRAGVPILESLMVLQKQMKSKRSIALFAQVIHDVSNGQYLATSLLKFKKTFGEFSINIIRVGESGGILGQNLNYLADELKKKEALKKKVLGALFYPAFIVLATLGMTGVLTVFVFPKVLPIFSSVNVALPLSTKILIFTSRFLIHYGFLLIALAGVLVAGVSFCMRIEHFRKTVEKIVLKIPLVGNVFQNYYLANFCRTLGLLLKGEMRLEEAVGTTAATTENLVYKQELESLASEIIKGGKISRYMAGRPNLFPNMLGNMIAIGETAGNLGETFLYLAEMYESEVDELTKNLSGLLEPVLMVFMGLLVGFVAISIITPIYAVTQKLRP